MKHLNFKSILATWHSMNAFMAEATEEEAKLLLMDELDHGRRLQFLIRIYGRFSKLRTKRERYELTKKAQS